MNFMRSARLLCSLMVVVLIAAANVVFVSAATPIDSEVSTAPSNSITFNNDDITITMSVKSETPQKVRNGSGIQLTAQGAQLIMPSNSTLDMFSQNDIILKECGDGSVLVLNQEEKIVAAISAPAAQSTVDVETNGESVTYSSTTAGQISVRVAWSYNFFDWFRSGYWRTRADGVCLTLVPNGFQNTWDPDLALMHFTWDRVAGKFASSGNWYNYYGLENQYDCHYVYAKNEPDWNLEPWRPYAGWPGTIAARCNPV